MPYPVDAIEDIHINDVDFGIALLNNEGIIRYLSPIAKKILNQNQELLFISEKKQLSARNNDKNLRLQGIISNTLESAQEVSRLKEKISYNHSGVIFFPRKKCELPLKLTISPVSKIIEFFNVDIENVQVVIFLTDPKSIQLLTTKYLQDVYLLTARECDICYVFRNTASLEGVMEATGLTKTTIRSYMRDIFQKTGVKSQPELMRFLMELVLL